MPGTLNPALAPFEFLIGDWGTTGTHPQIPGETLHGRASFAWHEGGAFLVMRSRVDHPLFPAGVSIIGSDGTSGKFAMLYFDERGVSRLFEVEVADRMVSWRRDDPEFAQSTTLKADPPDRLTGTGRRRIEGGDWADDLSQTYTRDPGGRG